MRRRRTLAAAAAALATVLVTGYHRLLLGDLVFSRDVSRLYYPLKVYIVSRLRHGHLPLWYPFESLGTPCLAAGVTAVLHPLTWLAVLVGPLLGHALATLLCVVLAATGTFLLARRLGADRKGAALALVIAVGGGSFVSTLDNQPFLWGATAFPFFLLGVLAAVRRRDPLPGVALAAGALLWAVLAGDFEATYLFGLTGLALGLALRRGSTRRALALVAVTGALGLALGAVQVLPSLDALRHIDRAHGLPWATAARWSMDPLRVPELFLGDLLRYRPLGTGVDVHRLVVSRDQAPWQLSTFLGAVALVGLVLVPAAGRGRRKVAGVLTAIAAGLLWLALGRHGGLYRLAYTVLPVWRAFRYPEKLLPYAQILLAAVAGLSVTAARRRPRPAAAVALGLAGVLVVATVGLALAAGRATGPLATWLLRARGGALEAAGIAAALGLSWWILARQRTGRTRAVLALLPAACAVLQLGPLDGRLLAMMSGPPVILTAPSVGAATLRAHGLEHPGQARVTTWSGTTLGLRFPDPDPDVAEGFAGRALWDRAALAPDHAGLFHIEATTHYLPVVTPRYRREVDHRPLRWITRDAAIFNGRFDVVDRPTFVARGLPWAPVILDREDIGLVVVEDAGALPRAFVTAPRPVADGDAAFRALATPAVARGRLAVVEGSAGGATPAPSQGPVPARIVSYAPERVVVEATTARAGVLVLNDGWAPGWRVTVDGRPSALRRANYLVRGVALPAGTHRVVFTYPAPASLWVGAAVSLASLLALGAVALLHRRRHRW